MGCSSYHMIPKKEEIESKKIIYFLKELGQDVGDFSE